jgi:hypothetical protein
VARLLFRQWRDLPGGLDEALLNRDLPVHLDPAGYPTSNRPGNARPGNARPGGEATLAARAVTNDIAPAPNLAATEMLVIGVVGQVSIRRGAVLPTTDGTAWVRSTRWTTPPMSASPPAN